MTGNGILLRERVEPVRQAKRVLWGQSVVLVGVALIVAVIGLWVVPAQIKATRELQQAVKELQDERLKDREISDLREDVRERQIRQEVKLYQLQKQNLEVAERLQRALKGAE